MQLHKNAAYGSSNDNPGRMTGRPPIGEHVEWTPARRPERRVLEGRLVRLRPVDPEHDAEPLFRSSHPPAGDPEHWTYLPYGPYDDAAGLRGRLEETRQSEDPLFFTLVLLPKERPAGIASYLRITPDHGTIEIGHIWFGAELRRSAAATEAIFLLAHEAFDGLGYRRLEWKCNALNQASCRAAERFGFRFEGVFRKHQVVKGRNRDTAWFAITDDEWPALRAAYEKWLAPENFDAEGRQRQSLRDLIAAHAG
jgi:RimJ/RimL family protein N-acetyltransferase